VRAHARIRRTYNIYIYTGPRSEQKYISRTVNVPDRYRNILRAARRTCEWTVRANVRTYEAASNDARLNFVSRDREISKRTTEKRVRVYYSPTTFNENITPVRLTLQIRTISLLLLLPSSFINFFPLYDRRNGEIRLKSSCPFGRIIVATFRTCHDYSFYDGIFE